MLVMTWHSFFLPLIKVAAVCFKVLMNKKSNLQIETRGKNSITKLVLKNNNSPSIFCVKSWKLLFGIETI